MTKFGSIGGTVKKQITVVVDENKKTIEANAREEQQEAERKAADKEHAEEEDRLMAKIARQAI